MWLSKGRGAIFVLVGNGLDHFARHVNSFTERFGKPGVCQRDGDDRVFFISLDCILQLILIETARERLNGILVNVVGGWQRIASFLFVVGATHGSPMRGFLRNPGELLVTKCSRTAHQQPNEEHKRQGCDNRHFDDRRSLSGGLAPNPLF